MVEGGGREEGWERGKGRRERERGTIIMYFDPFHLPSVDCGYKSNVPSGVLCVQLVWSSDWREGPLHSLV